MEFALVHVVTDRASINWPRWTNNARFRRSDMFVPPLNRVFDDLERSWIESDRLEDRAEGVDWGRHAGLLNERLDTVDGEAVSAASFCTVEAPSFVDRVASSAVSIRDHLQPQGDVHNDDTLTQRVLNIVTSLPIVALGWGLRGKLSSAEGRSYANSLVAVGVAATAYHCSWGKLRRTTRKADYWAISYSSGKLVRALWPGETTKKLETLMHCMIPFRPFWVSTACALAMQAEFVRLGVKNEALRLPLKKHLGAAAFSGAAFGCEDVLAEKAGWIGRHTHSLWHLASAYGLKTVFDLVEYKEQMRGSLQTSRVHDSAGSLYNLESDYEKLRKSKE